MNYQLVRGLTFTISISIGALGFSFSGDSKGKLKADVNLTVGNFARGVDACVNCDPSESKEGTGAYIKKINPISPFTALETKVYDDGKISTDFVASLKDCYKKVCGKVAVKERVADNFAEKKGLSLTYPIFSGNSLKPNNKITIKKSSPISDEEALKWSAIIASTRTRKIFAAPAEPNRHIQSLTQAYKTDLPKFSLKASQIRLLENYKAYNRVKKDENASLKNLLEASAK